MSQTPTFIIGGKMIPGAIPYDTFKKLVDEELVKAPAVDTSATAPATPTGDTAKSTRLQPQ